MSNAVSAKKNASPRLNPQNTENEQNVHIPGPFNSLFQAGWQVVSTHLTLSEKLTSLAPVSQSVRAGVFLNERERQAAVVMGRIPKEFSYLQKHEIFKALSNAQNPHSSHETLECFKTIDQVYMKPFANGGMKLLIPTVYQIAFDLGSLQLTDAALKTFATLFQFGVMPIQEETYFLAGLGHYKGEWNDRGQPHGMGVCVTVPAVHYPYFSWPPAFTDRIEIEDASLCKFENGNKTEIHAYILSTGLTIFIDDPAERVDLVNDKIDDLICKEKRCELSLKGHPIFKGVSVFEVLEEEGLDKGMEIADGELIFVDGQSVSGRLLVLSKQVEYSCSTFHVTRRFISTPENGDVPFVYDYPVMSENDE